MVPSGPTRPAAGARHTVARHAPAQRSLGRATGNSPGTSDFHNLAGRPFWASLAHSVEPPLTTTRLAPMSPMSDVRVKGRLSRLVSRNLGEVVSGLDETSVSPQELLSFVEQEAVRIRGRFDAVKTAVPSDVCDAYLVEFNDIARRIDFWSGEIGSLPAKRTRVRQQHAVDIVIGERILLDRVLRLGAEIYSEPLPDDGLSGIGLRTRNRAARPLRTRPAGTPKDAMVSALVNHEVGYGPTLRLRPHQLMAHNAFKGVLRLRAAQSRDSARVPEALLRGTIVMPTGGGKTRVMVAASAAALAEGAWDPGRGDKILILNEGEQIHRQNVEVVERLGPYFERQMGRPLRVSVYKADDKDLSGDVVVVHVSSVNQPARREVFAKALQHALGTHGTIPLVHVDEIHHLELGRGKGQESWIELMATIRTVSPQSYRLGFTATPTGREGPYIIRLREHDLMLAGVTPRTYLVKVPGVDLSQLKITQRAHDVSTLKLVSTLLGFPRRNQQLYEALATHGLQATTASPSGRARLEPVLAFAADLQHARMMVEAYRDYFAKPGEGLGGRRLLVLGTPHGTISERAFSHALEQYDAGACDGLIVMISGSTKPSLRRAILGAVEDGKIEAVCNIDVWLEGADLYMFTHLLGSRPTFSRFKKGQERGRLNRRGPDEVSPRGELLRDAPKILFDVLDRYDSHERRLFSYGDVMGAMGYSAAPSGTLFDAMAGDVVSAINVTGDGIVRHDLVDLTRKKPPVKKPSRRTLDALPWKPLVEKLWAIVEAQYGRDVGALALDLGLPSEEMEQILQGTGWINARWFLRRLATLLYQDRETFLQVYNAARGRGGRPVTHEDHALIRGALAIFEAWHGTIDGSVEITGDVGWGRQVVRLTRGALQRVTEERLTEGSWARLWQGLMLYFVGEAHSDDPERKRVAQDWIYALGQHFWTRAGWTDAPKTAPEQLRAVAREGVALRFGRRLPIKPDIPGIPEQGTHGGMLSKWLAGTPLTYVAQLTPKNLYDQIHALVVGLGQSAEHVDPLIEAAVFEEQGWPTEAATGYERLRRAARQAVARHFGGVLAHDHGIANLPRQIVGQSTIYRWLGGETITYRGGFIPELLYAQVEALCVGLGHDPEDVERLIQEAVFDEQGWSTVAETPKETLVYAARLVVARRFRGMLPVDTGIPELPVNARNSAINRWLAGEEVRWNASLTDHIRALLRHGGVAADEAQALVEEATTALPARVTTRSARVTMPRTRRSAGPTRTPWMARDQPAPTSVSGVPQADLDLLWGGLQVYETVEGAYTGTTHVQSDRGWGDGRGTIVRNAVMAMRRGNLNDQQWRTLWHGLMIYCVSVRERDDEHADVARDWIDTLRTHFFTRESWTASPTTAQGRLVALAREAVIMTYQGNNRPWYGHALSDVPERSDHAPLFQWLQDAQVRFHTNYRPHNFYQQVRALLIGLGVDADQADAAIVAAVFERNGWPEAATTAEARLRLLARQYVARAFGGELPIFHGIEGISMQVKPGASLSAWIAGQPLTFGYGHQPHQFYPQVLALLLHGAMERGPAERALMAAIRERNGWPEHGETAVERLRVLLRTEIARRFGGKVPEKNHGIAGVPHMQSSAPLTRFVEGDPIRTLFRGVGRHGLYTQIRALGLGLGIHADQLDAAIIAAVYATEGWTAESQTPEEQLRDVARRYVARAFGGQLGTDHGVPGVGVQDRRAPLTRWLEGRAVNHSEHLWSHVRALLRHSGLAQQAIDDLIAQIAGEQ